MEVEAQYIPKNPKFCETRMTDMKMSSDRAKEISLLRLDAKASRIIHHMFLTCMPRGIRVSCSCNPTFPKDATRG